MSKATTKTTKYCDIVIAGFMIYMIYYAFTIDVSSQAEGWGVFIGLCLVFGILKLAKAVIVSIAKGFDSFGKDS